MNPRQPTRIARRSFLTLAAGSAAAVPLLAACGSGPAGSGPGPSGGAAVDVDSVIPDYVPRDIVTPDFPSVDGSTPGYLSFPDEFVASVEEVPGRGSSFTAMTPLWSTVPPGLPDNSYMVTVNEEINADFRFQITDGNAYGEKLQAVLAAESSVPDFVTIPSWTLPPRFGQAAENLFADLTPHLAGDKITKYPNLANISSDAWRCCVFNGKLYGLPYPSDLINSVIFYRHDLTSELGIEVAPANAQEFLDLALELTDPGANRWAMNDMWAGAQLMFRVPDKWILEGGNLVHRVESEAYRQALEFQAELFAAGVVHPDAVAGNEQQARQRFISGEVVITPDGAGGWLSATREAYAGNPDYNQQPVPAFAGDGGTPVIFKGTPSNLFTFIKQTDDTERLEEQLALANYFAAPFGTKEQMLLEYGAEGVHHDLDDANVPTLNETGLREVARTYTWITRPPIVASQVQYPSYVEDFATWMAGVMEYAVDPVFYTQQIVEPPEFGALEQPFIDLEMDIARGRSDISALDAAIENWRSAGGEQLREFYAEYLDEQ
ncbi:extracellular solute-binding protein [Occultella kanbiaonis]|uniref:extracellular solute-binding protein n=1 Tax=Occultella kanbiaonis TaxID=2675754 RepID=UPI0012B820AA|nr:extracellular solute-binding protein [Occultella kanbiaonis]